MNEEAMAHWEGAVAPNKENVVGHNFQLHVF
jgi:hypothetical protein